MIPAVWAVWGFIALMGLFTFGAGKPGTETKDYKFVEKAYIEQLENAVDK